MEEIITIDGSGRLVIPKAFRRKLNLEKGDRLVIREEAGDRLVMEPVSDSAILEEVDGLLIIRGKIKGEIPDHREIRTERTRSLARFE